MYSATICTVTVYTQSLTKVLALGFHGLIGTVPIQCAHKGTGFQVFKVFTALYWYMYSATVCTEFDKGTGFQVFKVFMFIYAKHQGWREWPQWRNSPD